MTMTTDEVNQRMRKIELPLWALQCLGPHELYLLGWLYQAAIEKKEVEKLAEDPYTPAPWGGIVRMRQLKGRVLQTGRTTAIATLKTLASLGMIKKEAGGYWKILSPLHFNREAISAFIAERSKAKGVESELIESKNALSPESAVLHALDENDAYDTDDEDAR